MIRHLSRQHDVTVASLARSEQEAQEGEGLRAYCKHHVMGRVHDSVQTLRMIARLPTSTPSSMGYFYSPQLASRIDNLLAGNRYDLIFVHCSSVAQYVEHVRGVPKILDFGDMDSQKWLEYARYKPFPLSLGYRLEARQAERAGEAAGTPLRRLHDHHARRMGDARRLSNRGRDRTGFPTVSTANTSRQRTRPTTPTPSPSSAAWTTTRTRSACSTSVPTCCPVAGRIGRR